jgi:hypothetical protein
VSICIFLVVICMVVKPRNLLLRTLKYPLAIPAPPCNAYLIHPHITALHSSTVITIMMVSQRMRALPCEGTACRVRAAMQHDRWQCKQCKAMAGPRSQSVRLRLDRGPGCQLWQWLVRSVLTDRAGANTAGGEQVWESGWRLSAAGDHLTRCEGN